MARPLVLVTRSEPGVAKTVARLEERGLRAIATPMLAVSPRPVPGSFEGAQAVLVTSAHGARRLAEAKPPLPPVLAVGAAPNLCAWDGLDEAGRPAAPGVYAYRLEAAGERATRKMLLLR